MGRPELLRVAERGVVGVRGPNSGIRSGKKLMQRMETNSFDLSGLLWFLLGFSVSRLVWSHFTLFSVGSPFFLVPQALGSRVSTTWFMDPFGRFTSVVSLEALGLRYPSSGFGSKGSRLSDSLFQKLFLHHPAVTVYKWRVAIRLA